MSVVNFVSMNATSEQVGNPGGIRKLLRASARSIVGVWPKQADITAGEITVGPTMAGSPAAKWAEYECPDGTMEVTSEQQGNPGYQSFKHAIEFALAGFSKKIQNELAKDLNAGAVFIVEMNDGVHVVVGSSDNPIFTKRTFKGGKKGNDPRGFTLKGEQDGMMWDILPLAASEVADLEIAAIV